MKKIGWVFLLVGCAYLMLGCTPMASNSTNTTNSNANANTATKPVAAAPTADALMAQDKGATEA